MSGMVGEAFIRIRPNMAGFQGETDSGFKKAFASAAKIVGAAFATEKVIHFGAETLKAAASTKRATETIKEGFGAAGDAVTKFNEGAAAKLGISTEAGQEAASKFATLFSTLDVGKGKAADMTVNLEKMAGSLAEIKGVDPSEVMDKLFAASTGATRGLKSLGIVIDANTIKQKAAELGLVTHVRSTQKSEMADRLLAIAKAKVNDALARYGPNTTQVAQAQIGLERAQNAVTKALAGTTAALTPAQKTQAIYAALMDKMPGIQDAAAKHSDDLGASQQRLRAQWANLKEELAARTLPYIERVSSYFADKMPGAIKATEDKVQEVADRFRGPFNGALDKSKGILEAVADALKATVKFLVQYQNIFLPLSGAIGGVTLAMEAWTVATEVWTTVTKIATGVQAAFDAVLAANPIAIAVIAIAALAGALVVLYERSATVRRVINETWADIKVATEKTWGYMRTYVLDVFDIIKTIVVTDLKVIRDVFNVFKAVFTGDWAGAWNGVKRIFTDVWHGMSTVAGDVLEIIRKYVEKKALQIGLAIIEPFTHIPTWLGGGWAKDLKDKMTGALDALDSPAGRAGTNVGDQFGQNALDRVNSYMGQIQVAIDNAWRNAQSSVSQATNASPNRSGSFKRGTAPGASLGFDQIRALVRQAGGSAAEANYLATISGREDSTGQINALNDSTKTHDYSVGLFQINFRDMMNRWMRGGKAAAAKLAQDPMAQARYALSLLHSQGPSAWSTNTPAIQALLGGGGSKPPPVPGASTGDLTVGSSATSAASAAQQIASAKASLEASYKKVVASARDLGGELTGTVRKDLSNVRDEITHISSKGDVAAAKKNLDDLRTEVTDKLKQIRLEIALSATFDGLKTQVAKLGTEVTPQIRQEMRRIQGEIGKVSTPQQIADLRSQMTRVKNEIAAQLAAIKARVQTEKASFDNAWQSLASGADSAFQRATNKALQSMQVLVTGAFSSFQFGGSIGQTPTEQALAKLQSDHDAAAAAMKLAADQAQLALDLGGQGDATQVVADQAAVDDDLYAAKVAALQAQATLERDAANKQLQDAQQAYQDQRTLLQQQMDARVAAIQEGMLNGSIAAADGMAQLTAVLGDPQYGIDMQNSGLVIGGALFKGLSDGLAPVFDLIQKLIADMKAANLLPGAAPPPVAPIVGGGVQTRPGGIVKDSTGGYYDPSRGVYVIGPAQAAAAAKTQADILAELKKQTEQGQSVHVSVDGGANRLAQMVAR